MFANVYGLAKLPILKTKLRIKTLYGNFAKPLVTCWAVYQ